MPLGIEIGLSLGDFVLDGEPAPLPKRGRSPQIFGPCLLWPNGWMDQDTTWHGGWPQPRQLCVRWAPSPHSPKRGGGAKPPPQYSADFYCGQTVGCIKMPLRMDRPQPRGLCVRWGPSPPKFSAKFNCLLLYYCYCYFVRTLHSHYWFVQV